MATKRARLKSGFTLGGEQAEADPLLEDAFVESSDYRVMLDRKDPRCFVIGRTGSGKSAALQTLEERNSGHAIRINPEDLSLPYITDLQVIRYLDRLDVKLDLFWIALWKHVLLVEIIRHRYSVNSAEAKQRFMQTLRQRLARDPAKQAALDYLDEFEGRFWCEADERVREITDKFTKRFDSSLGTDVSLGGKGFKAGVASGFEDSQETKTEQAERFQRIVNETQLAKLNKMLTVLDEDILDTQHFTYVVIDDLDRDWVDERVANDLIRCLFRTVLDLKRVRNLKVLVALRTNIFQELDFGSRSGGQEEKSDPSSCRCNGRVPTSLKSWTNVFGSLAQRSASKQSPFKNFYRPRIGHGAIHSTTYSTEPCLGPAMRSPSQMSVSASASERSGSPGTTSVRPSGSTRPSGC